MNHPRCGRCRVFPAEFETHAGTVCVMCIFVIDRAPASPPIVRVDTLRELPQSRMRLEHMGRTARRCA